MPRQWSGSISRILFPRFAGDDHSSRPHVAVRLKRPTRKRRRRLPDNGRAVHSSFPYLVLHREEFTRPRLSPAAPTGPYPVISPITLSGWFAFCCTCRRSPEKRTPGCYPARCPFGVRTFLQPISGRRPSDQLHCLAKEL